MEHDHDTIKVSATGPDSGRCQGRSVRPGVGHDVEVMASTGEDNRRQEMAGGVGARMSMR